MFDLQDAIEEIEGRIDRLMQAENARHATRVLDLKTVRTRMIDEARAEWRKQT